MIRYREYGETHWERLHTRRGKLLLPTPRTATRDWRNPTDDEVADMLRRQPARGAGDIKGKYGTAAALTVTNLHSLASNSTFTTGWTSGTIDNTTNLVLNQAVGGVIYSGTTPNAGSIRAYAYASFDATNWPDIFSTGAEGTEGSGAILHDTEQLDGSLVWIWSHDVDTGTDNPHNMEPRSVRGIFGFVPRKWALYVAHNTVAALKSTGSALYKDEELAQYT